MKNPKFNKHKYMGSFYITGLYVFMRIYGLPITPIIYILMLISIIGGILYVILRRMRGNPLASYLWWKLTGQKSDNIIIIIKCLFLNDLLRNPVKFSNVDLISAISIFIIYFTLIGHRIYIY